MSIINVISIDPAQNAKSALSPEVFERIARECRITIDMRTHKAHASKFINHVFGISKNTSASKSRILFIARVLAGAAFIALSVVSGLSLGAFSASWVMLALGASLVAGVFTRITSFAAFGFLAYTLSLLTPEFSMTFGSTVMLTVGALLFAICGPGKFSTDQLTRRLMIRYSKKRARIKAEKLAEKRLSYQAMRYV